MAISKIVTNSVDSGVTLTSPTLVTPALGTPASGVLTNCTGVAKAALPAGCVLQVVSTTKTDTFSTTSTTFVDITGLSASITPRSASSKILIIYNYQATCTGAVTAAFSRLMRDSTAIAVGDASGSRSRGTSAAYTGDASGTNGFVLQSANFLDSPSTTSALTYKVQMFTQSGTAYVSRSTSDSDASISARNVASITLMEIQG